MLESTNESRCITAPLPHSPHGALTYLSANIQLVSEHGCRHLCSSSSRTLAVPRTRTTLGDRSFAVAGPRVWNSLPAIIRQFTSYGQFRQHLKTHLFRALEIAAHCDSGLLCAIYKYSHLLTSVRYTAGARGSRGVEARLFARLPVRRAGRHGADAAVQDRRPRLPAADRRRHRLDHRRRRHRPEPAHSLHALRSSPVTACHFEAPPVAWWPGGVVVRALDLRLKRSPVRISAVPLSGNNRWQVVHTHVPLSPSSIIRYRSSGGDALRLGR